MATRMVLLAGVIAFVAGVPAHAERYRLTAAGTVNRIAALQDYEPTTTPAGTIRIGDRFTLEATFDTSTAELQSLFDADPTVNIYYLPGASISVRIGSYTSAFSPPFSLGASFQLWDNRQSVGEVDSQSFSSFNYNIQRPPFDVGAGLRSESVDLYAFDFSARARSNDLISQLSPYSAFLSKSLTYGLLNSDANLFVQVSADLAEAELTQVAAVPEPATWAMLIIGFGLIGSALRRRVSLSGSAPA